MPVIAVVNRKGGSGKSTLAAHLAAWCAHQGHSVMLGDVDRQQSSRSWLRKRSAALPSIAPWTVDQNILRVPTGITHVILDTPGGMHGLDLARMVMFADLVIMPVCGSAFDRESAADCYAELQAMPRVATGRCKIACIGMRIDPRTRAPQTLKEWANDLGMPFLGILRESQAYVQCLERGMTIFDLRADRVETDLRQWQPILSWLTPQLAVPTSTAGAPPMPSHPPSAPRVFFVPYRGHLCQHSSSPWGQRINKHRRRWGQQPLRERGGIAGHRGTVVPSRHFACGKSAYVGRHGPCGQRNDFALARLASAPPRHAPQPHARAQQAHSGTRHPNTGSGTYPLVPQACEVLSAGRALCLEPNPVSQRCWSSAKR